MKAAGSVHRITAQEFDELAVGRPGPGSLKALWRSQLSRRLLSLHSIAGIAEERVPDLWRRSGAGAAWELLAEVDRVDRPALERVVMHPLLGVLLSRCLRRLNSPAVDPVLDEDLSRLGAVAAAAALRAGVSSSTIELPVHDGVVALPTWGVARVPAGSRRAGLDGRVLSASGFTVELSEDTDEPPPGAPGWLPLRWLSIRAPVPFGPRLSVTLEDGDPERRVHGLSVGDRLGPDRITLWSDALRDAWELLVALVPERAAACAALCRCVVPLSPPPGRRVSSASREAFGAVGLSLSRDPAWLAEALVHEVSHIALGALGDLVDLVDPEYATRHPVGWRADLRPLSAVLQGTYAHLAALEFQERLRASGHGDVAARAELRCQQLRTQVRDAVDILHGSSGLTTLGRRFCAALTAAVAGESVQAIPRYSNG